MDVGETDAALAQLEEQIAALNEQLEEEQAQNASLEENVDALTAERDEAQDALAAAQDELAGAQAELTSTKDLLDSAQAELASTKDLLDGAQAELVSTQTALESAQTDLTNTQTDLENTQATLASTQTDLENTQATLASTQEELAQVTAEYQAYLMERTPGEAGSVARLNADNVITLEDGATGTLNLSNLTQSENDCEIEITLAQTGEVLYRSQRLKAGETLETITLETPLSSGTYDVFVKTHTYAKDTGERIASLTLPAVIEVP